MLLAFSEDQWYERKSARVPLKKLGAALVEFANAEGGTIIIGLSDGEVEGIDSLSSIAQNDLRQAHITQVNPPVTADYEVRACLKTDGTRANLLIVQVAPSE